MVVGKKLGAVIQNNAKLFQYIISKLIKQASKLASRYLSILTLNVSESLLCFYVSSISFIMA